MSLTQEEEPTNTLSFLDHISKDEQQVKHLQQGTEAQGEQK